MGIIWENLCFCPFNQNVPIAKCGHRNTPLHGNGSRKTHPFLRTYRALGHYKTGGAVSFVYTIGFTSLAAYEATQEDVFKWRHSVEDYYQELMGSVISIQNIQENTIPPTRTAELHFYHNE